MDANSDYLFISYASEDYELAEWLTLKLTGQGYLVWCDRIKLLGGESYPRDIDRAIKEQTFRLLALLSRHSISKPRPVKERTLALNIGQERGVDFLIPLNVDGLSSTELDWMTSDITFIAFHENWASGFSQLLEKLDSIGAPRPRARGREDVCQWSSTNVPVSEEPEQVWTNLLEIKELPRTLLRFSRRTPSTGDWPEEWPHYRQDDGVAWAFEPPPGASSMLDLKSEEVAYEDDSGRQGVRLKDAVSYLVRRHLTKHCLAKGLRFSVDRKDLYFPADLCPKNRLTFESYDGRKTWVQAVGERTFRQRTGLREVCRYHLSPGFRPVLRAFDIPVIQVQLRVHLTDARGSPLEPRKALRRRKAICKRWWNREWLSRLIGVFAWLSDGQESFCIAEGASGRLILSGTPLRLTAPFGIDESALTAAKPDEDAEIIEDDMREEGDTDGSE